MKNSSLWIRALALTLVLLMLFPVLLACAEKDPSAGIDADKVVGEVGGVKIRYDELYFLMKSYAPSLAKKHAGDPAALAKALDDLAKEELIANAAILLLCKEHGLKYRESKLSAEVDDTLYAILQTDFGGDEAAYNASLAELGVTKHHLRYMTGLDLLYDELMTVYPEEGLVITDPTAFRTYVSENFVHVYHIAQFNDTPEEDSASLAKITEAYYMLEAETTTMRKLIGSAYNEDFSDVSGNGFYITRGTWDEEYEKTAFSLGLGEHSGVVRATGVSPKTNQTVDTYYLILRTEIDDAYVSSHLSELQDEYYRSVIYSDLMAKRATLSFEPNDFYASLDLTNLPAPVEKETPTLLIVLLSVGGGAILVAGGVFVVLKIRKKKSAKK